MLVPSWLGQMVNRQRAADLLPLVPTQTAGNVRPVIITHRETPSSAVLRVICPQLHASEIPTCSECPEGFSSCQLRSDETREDVRQLRAVTCRADKTGSEPNRSSLTTGMTSPSVSLWVYEALLNAPESHRQTLNAPEDG